MWVFRIIRSNRLKKSFFVHFHVWRLIEYEFAILSPLSTSIYVIYVRNPCGSYNPPQFANHHSWLLRKEYSGRPRGNAVKCHVMSSTVWLWHFTEQSVYVHMSNSNEIITQWGFVKEGYQFMGTLWPHTAAPMFICVGEFMDPFPYNSNSHYQIG
jgi:hypothetical protein